MTLDITPEEHAVLSTLFLTAQQAMKDFQTAFKTSLAARGLTDGVFVSLSPKHLTIDTPDAFTTG